MRRLWLGVGAASGTQFYAMIVALVSLLATGRWLGPEGRGTLVAITTWVTVFAAAGGLSLGQVSLHRATELRGTPWLGPVVGTLLWIGLWVTGGIWIAVVVLAAATDGRFFNLHSPVLLAIGFVNLPFLLGEQYGSAVLSAVDAVGAYNRALVIGRTLTLLLVLAGWLFHGNEAVVLLAVIAGQASIAMGCLYGIRRRMDRRPRPDRHTARTLLKGALRLHPNYIGGVLVTSSGVLVVNHLLGNRETGWFQLAAQLVSILTMVPQAASMLLAGRVAALGPREAWGVMRRMLPWLLGALLVAAVVSFLCASVAIPWVMGERFAPAVPIFRILLLTLPGSALASLMAPQWIGRGLFGQLSALSLILGVVSVVGQLLAVQRVGLSGAAWVSVGTYGLALLIQLGMVWRCELSWRALQAPAAS